MIMWIFLWLFFAVLVGSWAKQKGHSGIGYFFVSLILSPLIGAIIVAVSAPVTKNVEKAAIDSGDMKKCPACAELIKREATKCRFCGTEQSAESARPVDPFAGA